MEAKTKKTRKPRKPPKVHIEIVDPCEGMTMYEKVMHWKPHLERMYEQLGYGKVEVNPTQKCIDEWNALQAQKSGQ